MATKRVLVVDDDQLVRVLVSTYLTHGGYEALAAASGAEGVAMYESERPDLVVLDIAMPEMTGFEVADAIREMEAAREWPRTPIVLLTAFARSFFVPVGHDQRIDSFVSKPITRDELLKHIKPYLSDPVIP